MTTITRKTRAKMTRTVVADLNAADKDVGARVIAIVSQWYRKVAVAIVIDPSSKVTMLRVVMIDREKATITGQTDTSRLQTHKRNTHPSP